MLIDVVNAAVKIIPRFEIRIDGVDFTRSFGAGWSVTHDTDAAFAAGTFPVETPFTLTAGRHTVSLKAGWNDQPLATAFTGEIVQQSSRLWLRKDTLVAGGFLKRCEVGLAPTDTSVYVFPSAGPQRHKAYYANASAQALIEPGYQQVAITSDADLIIDILAEYGLTAATVGIDIPASDFLPAQIDPIRWDYGTPGWSLISEIDRIADWRTADSRTGGIIRRQVFGTVPAGVRHTFQQGVDILDLQTNRDYNPYNQVIVRGAMSGESVATADGTGTAPFQVVGIAPQGAPAPSPYIPNPPGVRTDEGLSSPLIESNDAAVVGVGSTAQALADRRLVRVSQPLLDPTLVTFGCPDVELGDTLGLDAPAMPLAINTFLIGHTLSGGPLRSSLRLRGSAVAETRVGQAPLPQAVITVTQEWVIISGTLTKVAVITVDATASSDPDGSIASTSINIGGTVYPVNFVSHLTTAASPVGVTVTVTDNDGNSASTTRQATWDDATVLKEPITLAESTQAAASEDGEQTWRVQTAPDATAVGPIALAGTTLYGCSDGTLYRSTDLLLTAPALVHTFAAQVNCLWNNEQHTTRWLAGLSNGQAWLSIDDGLTWRLLHTFAAAVNDISESPFQPGEMTVCSGPSLWHTFNAITWDALITVAGQTCTRFAAGFGKAYAAFANGTIRNTANGTIITVPGAPQITGLTLAVPFEELYIFTNGTAAYRWTPGGGLVAGPSTGSAVNRAIRSGTGGFVYLATANALQKWFPRGSAWDVRLHSSGAVGYGSARTALVPSESAPAPVVIGPTVIVSTHGIDKARSLWNGSSNDAPPANWYAPGFDDSAWATAVLRTPFSGWTPVAGSEPIWPSATTTSTEQALFRRHFTLPPGTVDRATLSVLSDNKELDIYVNGWRVGGDGVDNTAHPTTPKTFSVGGRLLPGAENVLAFRIAETSGVTSWLSYKLEVNL